MKHLLFAAVLATATVPAFASSVGVSISIGQPGFYGQIDIGDFPPPQVIYSQPRFMYQAAMSRPPIYLHVPPGHAKNWRNHCREYNACSERVYFVQNNWYEHEYVPYYQKQQHDGGDGRRDERHAKHGNDHQGQQNKNHGKGHGQSHNH